MNEPQYKPITGMINVNDIQEIIENNRYYQEEIERLNNDIKELLKENSNKEKVIIAQDNIIKEVREYIEENQEEHKYTDRGGFTYTEGHFLRDSDTLLEILDKENNNEDN